MFLKISRFSKGELKTFKLKFKKLICSIKKSFVVSQNVKLVKNKQSQPRFINFLPTCNLVIKRSILQDREAMDERLFAHEDITLNENIKK